MSSEIGKYIRNTLYVIPFWKYILSIADMSELGGRESKKEGKNETKT